MTEETANSPQQAVSDIVQGVVKKTLMLTAGAIAGVFIYRVPAAAEQRWWQIPASILFGAALGLVNFRWLAVAVERVYLRKGATPGVSNVAAAIINILKLAAIFIVLFVVIRWQVLNVFGLVGGLSLCFLAILWQGLTLMKNVSAQDR
jgi:hypothetical protein